MKHGCQITTERLIIRNWTLNREDRQFFHFIVSNEAGRRFYPSRLNKDEANELLQDMVSKVEQTGYGWSVACLKNPAGDGAGTPVGFIGLSLFQSETDFAPCVEIGWQFDPKFWGKGYATEGAKSLISHGFKELDLKEIYAFAVPANTAPSP